MVLILAAAASAASCGKSADGRILVSGNIEAEPVELAFQIPGRILSVRISEGVRVNAGDVVAELDNAELEKELALRAADLDAARAALAELEAGTRPEEIGRADAAVAQAREKLREIEAGPRLEEIASANASLTSARADSARAAAEYNRVRQLYDESVAPERDLEFANAAMIAAEARAKSAEEYLHLLQSGSRPEQIAQAKAAHRQAEKQLELAKNGPRKETLDAARARLKSAETAVEYAKVKISRAVLRTPVSGIVLSEGARAGEYVSPGTPVGTAADISTVFLRAYIEERDLGRVKLGAPVNVTTDSFSGKKYAGKIVFIASDAEFTPKNIQTQKERVKLVYRIKVEIPNPGFELKPGMSADAEIAPAKTEK
jgi:HlyD family secretion protein